MGSRGGWEPDRDHHQRRINEPPQAFRWCHRHRSGANRGRHRPNRRVPLLRAGQGGNRCLAGDRDADVRPTRERRDVG